MPIQNLSDIRRVSRGGHLRLGEVVEKQKDGRTVTYPTKSDHFIADFDNPELAELFASLYGPEPKRVTVAFPSDDANQFFPQWYDCYSKGSGLKCRGDGETANRATADGNMTEVDCPGPEGCEYGQDNGCRRCARLQVFIKGLPTMQVFQINTSSFHSIVNINSAVDLLRFARGGRGIAGVWVDIILREQQATVKSKSVTIYVLDIVIPVSLDNARQLRSAVEAVPQLPAPSNERDPLLYPEHGFEPEPAEPEPEKPKRAAKPKPCDFADDPDVLAAFDAARTVEFKRHALLKSAKENDWSKTDLIKAIGAKPKQAKPAADDGPDF